VVDGINPAWADLTGRVNAQVVASLFGDIASMKAEQWAKLSASFTAHEIWINSPEGAVVECFGIERVRQILAGDGEATVTALIAKDKALESEVNAIASVDKLIGYQRDPFTLLNNFVSFRDFNTPATMAILVRPGCGSQTAPAPPRAIFSTRPRECPLYDTPCVGLFRCEIASGI